MPAVPFSETAIVNINPTALSEFMRGPGGPVVRKMTLIGESVKLRTIAGLKSGFPRDFLGPQIVKRVTMTEQGPWVIIGAVRLRTQPHPIVGNPLLVFYWPKVGRVVAFRRVNHPGSNFGQYVSTKLLAALASIRGGL